MGPPWTWDVVKLELIVIQFKEDRDTMARDSE